MSPVRVTAATTTCSKGPATPMARWAFPTNLHPATLMALLGPRPAENITTDPSAPVSTVQTARGTRQQLALSDEFFGPPQICWVKLPRLEGPSHIEWGIVL